MRDYEEIRDTSPLSLKKLNDQFRLLWFKTKNITGKDIRVNSIEAKHIAAEAIEAKHIKANELVVGDNVGLGVAQDESGVVSIINGTVTADYINAKGIKAESIIGGSFSGKTFTGGSFVGGSFKTIGSEYLGHFELKDGQLTGTSDNDSKNFIMRPDWLHMGNGTTYIDLHPSKFSLVANGGLAITQMNGYEIRTGNLWAYDSILGNPLNGTSDRIYFGPKSYGTHLYVSSGVIRLQASGTSGITVLNNGAVLVYANANLTHAFYADGTKMGGSIKLDDTIYGMSPVDSPRIFITDIFENIQLSEDGTKVTLNEAFSKAINGYTLFFNKPAEIVEKHHDYFIVKGKGIIDILLIGKRVGYENTYWITKNAVNTIIDEDAITEGGIQ